MSLRRADVSDLESVNLLVESAIDTWDIPGRVKRLSIPLYRYAAHDLDFMELVVAEARGIGIVGIAAWEQACPGDAPTGHSALLLHGIYVAPDQQRNGVATRLLEAAESAAASRGLDGLLVKGQPGAEHFFLACGLERLAVENQRRDYPHRFWKSVKCG
jgi:GNAT superfamily N-acetyltransferase